MRRRALLAAIAAGTAAGCTSSGGTGVGDSDGSPSTDAETATRTDAETETDTETATDTSTPTDTTTTTDPSATDSQVSTVEADAGRVTFERTGDCPPSDTGATVETDDGVVVVAGCIEGSTGCSQPEFRSARLADDRLVVTVGTVETEEICTQQLVYRGYTARVETDGDRPATVEVRHADDGETTTVAETTV